MRSTWVWSMAVLALLAAACGSGADIEVADVWGRPSPSVATNGAFYMVITNNTEVADHLVAASSPACAAAELHESMMNDGVMGMAQVGPAGIEIPANGQTTLEVGGLHVMCIDKQAEFVAGERFDVTLEFENAGTVEVQAEIKES
ncbi:MAG: copper chaperone PCu(A)C [Acidimicrobiia bacterium]|nr:copper chaperone PCu(A)C [Acidimicrobiia bacterium]